MLTTMSITSILYIITTITTIMNNYPEDLTDIEIQEDMLFQEGQYYAEMQEHIQNSGVLQSKYQGDLKVTVDLKVPARSSKHLVDNEELIF